MSAFLVKTVLKITHPEIAPVEKTILAAIAVASTRQGVAKITSAKLMENACTTNGTFFRRIAKLKKSGLIFVSHTSKKNGRRGANIYILNSAALKFLGTAESHDYDIIRESLEPIHKGPKP